MFRATNIVENNDKEKYVYRFGNNYAKNIAVFDVDSSSTSHTDNCKNKFLALG